MTSKCIKTHAVIILILKFKWRRVHKLQIVIISKMQSKNEDKDLRGQFQFRKNKFWRHFRYFDRQSLSKIGLCECNILLTHQAYARALFLVSESETSIARFRFEDVEGIKRNLISKLYSILKEQIERYFVQLEIHWSACVQCQEVYFEASYWFIYGSFLSS